MGHTDGPRDFWEYLFYCGLKALVYGEIFCHGSIHSWQNTIKELLSIVAFLTGSQFVQVFRKVQFLGHFCIDKVDYIVSNRIVKLFADDIALYKEIVLPYDQSYYKKTWLKFISGLSWGNLTWTP